MPQKYNDSQDVIFDGLATAAIYVAYITLGLYSLFRILKFLNPILIRILYPNSTSNLPTEKASVTQSAIAVAPVVAMHTPIVNVGFLSLQTTTAVVAAHTTVVDARLLSLQAAYRSALKEFEGFINGTTTCALGIKNGFFSMKRHESMEPTAVLGALSSSATYDSARQYCKQQITFHGSLYDPRKGENHSFANFFLTALYRHDVTAYRNVVGSIYGIVFLDSTEISLYRRDTRHYRTIFEKGFELQSCNKPYIRKHHYSEPWTYSYGVSMARIIPSDYYGKGGYFTITFPAGHQFLLIDIVETARVRGRLRERNNVENVLEINSMQSVPRGCVRFFNLESSQRKIENLNKTPASPSPTQFGVY